MTPLLACAKGFCKPWGSVLVHRNRVLLELHIYSSIRIRSCCVKLAFFGWLYEFVAHLLSYFKHTMP